MFLSELPNAPNRAEVENLIATLDQAIKDEVAAQPPPNTLPPTEKQAQPAPLLPPPPPPAPPPPRHTWWMIGVGAGLLAVGAVGIGTGAGALAVNGDGSCTLAPGQVRCPKVYNTAGEGGALLGVGIAAAAAGAALIIVEERRYHANVHASIVPSPSGGAFVLSGEF